MAILYRFSEYEREVGIEERRISYNALVPPPEKDEQGQDVALPLKPLHLRPVEIARLVTPYAGRNLSAQFKAVAPLAIYLALFQFLVLNRVLENAWQIGLGLVAVIVGLVFFLEGLSYGLMPFGRILGDKLPIRSPLWLVLLLVFLLGIGVTFAEPAIGALQTAGSIVDVRKAPILYAMLNHYTTALVLVVGAGVGLAAVLGTARFLYGWSLKPLLYILVPLSLLLSLYCALNDNLSPTLGLAWDCGAVTTGPVTVPLVLALGIGIASSAGKGNSSLSGFGIVTLASLFPVLAVIGLAIYVNATTTTQEIIALADESLKNAAASGGWRDLLSKTPYLEIVGGVRAIVPLVIFLYFILKVLLRERLTDVKLLIYGLVLAILGMCIFNVGLTFGLSQLGNQTGSIVPAAFASISSVSGSPLYSCAIGIALALFFAWALGLGATLAEPALMALGMTVENLTNGAFKKKLLVISVSLGVAFGIALGVVKIVFDIPLLYLLVPFYAVSLLLSWLSTEEFVNVAWDSAGVTTGPVTVPLVLAMGLGFGNALGVVEGFGILSMASIGPIIFVLITGLIVRCKQAKAAVVVGVE
ncbi:MAG: DUF1538 domain-containing protein [Lentisphaerae bacterium]|nr:DUF1538 domain-containing protein [Lentisphaerota bacterium]